MLADPEFLISQLSIVHNLRSVTLTRQFLSITYILEIFYFNFCKRYTCMMIYLCKKQLDICNTIVCTYCSLDLVPK